MKKLFTTLFAFVHNCLLRLGGYDPKLARMQSGHYQIRYAGYGLAILVTSALAYFSGWHTALSYSHNNTSAIIFGCLWACMIMYFEYSIVVYINRSNSKWVVPVRIFTSLVFSLLISTPLILMACQGPIQEQLSNEVSVKLRRADSVFQADKAALIDAPIAASNTVVQGRQNEVLAEADGSGGSGVRGVGKWTLLKQQALDTAKAQYDRVVADKQVELQTLTNNYNAENERIQKSSATDELAQLRALFKLLKEPAVLIRWLLLTLGIVLLETTPLLLKVQGGHNPNDPYAKDVEEEQKLKASRNKAAREQTLWQQDADIKLTRENIHANHRLDAMKVRTQNAADHLTTECDGMITILNVGEEKKQELSGKMFANPVALEKGTAIIDKLTERQVAQLTGLTMTGETIHDIPQPSPYNLNSYVEVNEVAEPYHVVIADNLSADHPFRLTPDMIAKAKELCKDCKTDNEKVDRLYMHLHDTIAYDYAHESMSGRYRTGEEVWNQKTGVCGEITACFCGMARVVGLKAAYATILVDEKGNADIHHACAAVTHRDGRLQLVDICYHSPNAQHSSYEVLDDQQAAERFAQWRSKAAAVA